MFSRSKPLRRRRAGLRTTKTLYRNRALLDLAEGRECMIRIPGVCCGGTESTVACHSNEARFGKAAGLKAHDWAAAWGCWTCHAFVDFDGKAPRSILDAYLTDGIKRTRLALIDMQAWPAEAEQGYQHVFGEAA